MIPIISATGIPRGKGSDRFKYVSFLSESEKAAVIRGETVLVACPWADGKKTTPFKRVYQYRDQSRRFGHENFYGDIIP